MSFGWMIGLLFPRRCPVCGEIVTGENKMIHSGCLNKLSPVKQPVCKLCGKEVISAQVEKCHDCRRRKRSFEGGVAALKYQGAARQSLAAVKYKNRREYLDFYAKMLDWRFEKWVGTLDCQALVPVPVHRARLNERGFNQARELAVRLGKQWNMPVKELLIRVKKTVPQRELGPGDRLENLKKAFALHTKAGKIPETVLLVDDIYTTGSTVEACARVLKKAGVKRVYFIVICIGSSDVA